MGASVNLFALSLDLIAADLTQQGRTSLVEVGAMNQLIGALQLIEEEDGPLIALHQMQPPVPPVLAQLVAAFQRDAVTPAAATGRFSQRGLTQLQEACATIAASQTALQAATRPEPSAGAIAPRR